MDKESEISKIRKLLNLQFNAEKIGSSGEAYKAAKIVKKLLMEYNLSMGDIGSEEEKNSVNITESDDITTSDRYGSIWKKDLLITIANNNLCSVYTRALNHKMIIIGAEDNVVIVKEFYDYLLKVFRRLAIERFNDAQNEVMQTGRRYSEQGRNRFIRSYLQGVSVGLQENYDSIKPTSSETALVVCHKELINSYLQSGKWFLSDKKERQRKTTVIGEAFDKGIDDGRKVSLNKQLDINNQQKIDFND